MDPETLQENFVAAVLYYCGVTNSDTNRYFGFDPWNISPAIGTYAYDINDFLFMDSWNLSYPIPSNTDLAIPTLEQVTTFYQNAYALPQLIKMDQPFAQLTTDQIAAVETSQLTQGSIITNSTTQTNLHLNGTSWVQSTTTNLTGVVTSVGSVTSIPNGNISNPMLANSAIASLSGTNSGDQTIQAANGFTAASGSNMTLGVSVTGLLVGSGGGIIAADSSQVTSKLLVGFATGIVARLSASDSILQALEKLDASCAGAPFLPLAGGQMAGPITGVSTLVGGSSGGTIQLNAATGECTLPTGTSLNWVDMARSRGRRAGGLSTVSYNAGQTKTVSFDTITFSENNLVSIDSSTGAATYTGNKQERIKFTYRFSVASASALTAGEMSFFLQVNGSQPTNSCVETLAWPALALAASYRIPVTVSDTFLLNHNDVITIGSTLSSGGTQSVNYYDITWDAQALPN